ncbi:hypothetical protein EYS14_12180 [Alteromonadaceae bacterium M269]|nr:hypothetical protein EYS14_12180 [Alteromonadaceae bacterium M269]
MRILKCLTLLSILSWSTLSFANFGVAFVHGTGSQSDALNDYWTQDFVNSVMSGNGNRFVVVNCDFEQLMWSDPAAGCLAQQLTQFIQSQNITSMYVITHSHGGNVMRWIMSNPTFDPRYPNIINTISRVTAVAPSSAGTPLADAAINGNVFETTLGFILGYASDAVRQQQVAWMAYYNSNFLLGTAGRPSLPSPFRSVVGSDVESSPFDGDSYCGGYQFQVALEVTQNFLDNCSDGFLECSSQSAAGSVWFRDTDRTAGREPLSHQQSRRQCFNLDVILRNDI